MIKILIYAVCSFLLAGCFILAPGTTSKVLYKGNFSESEKIKISLVENRGNNAYNILLHNKGALTGHIEIYDYPRFVISNLVLSDPGTRSAFRLVSDTLNKQLRCLDFTFLQIENVSATLSTFVPLTDREKKIFRLFSKALAESNGRSQLSEAEIERFKGWVRVYY